MFIIYYVAFLTTVFVIADGKYIDLLPEEEKQEFLDHVARRVMENVGSKESNTNTSKFSLELTDEQLKEHNEFVQTILQQEQQMRRNKGYAKSDGEESDEELKVQPLANEDNEKEVSEEDDQDSPMLDGRRNNDGEADNSTASEETATLNVTVQKRSIQSDDDSVEKDAGKTSAEIRTEVNEVMVSSKFQDLTVKKDATTFNYEENVGTEATLPPGNFRRSFITTSAEKEIDVTNDTSTTETVDTSTASTTDIATTDAATTQSVTEMPVTTVSTTELATEGITTDAVTEQTSTATPILITEEVQTTTEQDKPLFKPVDEDLTTANIDTSTVTSTLSSTLTDDGTTEPVTETTAEKSTAEIAVTKPTNDEQTLNNTTEIETTVTTEAFTTEGKAENDTTTVMADDNILTTTNIPVTGVTVADIEEVTTEKQKKGKKKHKTKSVKEKKIKEKKEKAEIKKEEEDKDFALIQKNVFETTLQKDEECGIQSCNRYRVYEVQWPVSAANQTPFLRSTNLMDDQPYFVPVYNYSPNKAYYNPQNRHGPNAVEDNSVDPDILRKGDILVNENAGQPEFEIDLDSLMSKFGNYDKQSNYDKIAKLLMKKLSTENEPILLKTLKVTKDGIVPVDTQKGGLKHQIKAVRDRIFNNKKLKHKKRQKKNIDDDLYKRQDMTNKDISVDYYYGRSIPKKKEIKSSNVPRSKSSEILNKIFEGHDIVKIIPFKHKREFGNSKNKPKILEKENNSLAELGFDGVKLQAVKAELKTKNNDDKFTSYMNALKELIVTNNKALKQYDWLSTTVQIHAALSKLYELIKRVQDSTEVHPADLQILKYAIFLHNFASEIRQANHFGSKLRNKHILPRNKRNKERSHVIKDKGLLNRVWLYLRTLMPDLTNKEELTDLNQFLMDVEDGLFDLHEAMKNIALITKYRHQNWYSNLKDLYLTTEPKQLREVLLHISFARLVDLVEYSCKHGVENDFVEFMKSHKKVAKRALEEVLFIIKIVDEINNNSD